MPAITGNLQMTEVLLVFARALQPGRVKTRLAASLGDEQALEVYRQLLVNTLDQAAASGLPTRLLASDHCRHLAGLAAERGMPMALQMDGDLGQRMSAALADAHAGGARRVVLVGSDCPRLGGDYLAQAMQCLRGRDFVLGPAEDGGYVLLGSARAQAWRDDTLAGVRFGGEHALADTRSALGKHGSVARLPERWDVDRIDDWRRAVREGLLPGAADSAMASPGRDW
jgi:rSAM/selenodomain-associated transferase 1